MDSRQSGDTNTKRIRSVDICKVDSRNFSSFIFPTSISVVPPYSFVSEVVFPIHYADKPQIESCKLK